MLPARLRAARIAAAPGAFRKIDRDEIPRDRSFRNIFLGHVHAPQPERDVTDRDGHQFRRSLKHALRHFHAAPAPHASLWRKSTLATKTGAGRCSATLATGPGKSARAQARPTAGAQRRPAQGMPARRDAIRSPCRQPRAAERAWRRRQGC